jgi:HEAT repeat protein
VRPVSRRTAVTCRLALLVVAPVGVRASAAVVLGALGPAAKPAIRALAGALKDPNPRVSELAGEALNRIASSGPNQPTLPLNCH